MANLFWIPKSPIKEWTVQTRGPILERGVPMERVEIPTFLGYGTKGALSRFKVPIASFQEPLKRHPALTRNKSGVNNKLNKEMNISAQFRGNFILQGIVTDANSNPINSCTVKLFREDGDLLLYTNITGSDGIFNFSLPNDSYKRYYITAKRSDIANTAGITSYILTPVQR